MLVTFSTKTTALGKIAFNVIAPFEILAPSESILCFSLSRIPLLGNYPQLQTLRVFFLFYEK